MILILPLFFVYVGTLATREAFTDTGVIQLALVFISVAIASKVMGSFLGARAAGFKGSDSLKIGVGMVPRMEVALVVATAAISQGIVGEETGKELLTVTLLLALFTTVVTPLIIRRLYARDMRLMEGIDLF